MRITLVPTVREIEKDVLLNKSAVMFDILRASSTISTVFANGCKRVLPVEEVADAFAVAQTLPENTYILGGERGAVKLPGFHLGNSPLEYQPDIVRDKTVILTTTNGTRAIRRTAEGSGPVLIGSLLNASAVAQKLLEMNQDIVLVCAGTRGKFSLEDTLAAGRVILEIVKRIGTGNKDLTKDPVPSADIYLDEVPILSENDLVLEDAALAALRLAEYYAQNPLQALQDSLHGQKLVQLGLRQDLTYCAQVNLFDVVPVYQDGVISVEID
ncbi:2-phosphosulfolactate phosphatase [Desulforamulus reducens MI-1]|uniref:Probable 2-phosphosulfolactate phosphatase n=1 Tax=Desulforamulus reducens (strain ATCC BAA-1160 / DSM 100696 / MI-1) TaxID=349161 RepID=A4J7A1_DESRM|nr:2-phosphosulfolactate phosphatase [Desulforamulus reducens]ABO50954.1 2-phosphosulfolactate phosphatase [Desulforamulus reducens MI-1]